MLRERGVSESAIQLITVGNPRRLFEGSWRPTRGGGVSSSAPPPPRAPGGPPKAHGHDEVKERRRTEAADERALERAVEKVPMESVTVLRAPVDACSLRLSPPRATPA